MAVRYKLSDGRDLQDVFASGNAGRTTGFKISTGSDLGSIFASGSSGILTGYKDTAGVDLGSRFGVSTYWENPAISSDGTIGGNSFAVAATGDRGNNGIWKAFNKNTSDDYFNRCGSGANQDYLTITMYNPKPVSITHVDITTAYYGFKTAILCCSGNGSNYIDVQQISGGTVNQSGKTISNYINSPGYYRYWKMRAIAINNNVSGWRNVHVSEIVLKGYVIY